MTGRKKNDSRIKGIPNRIISTGQDGQTIFIATGLVCGECLDCAKRIFVESNEGIMCCSHCGVKADRIRWIWGNIRTVFIPEGAAKILR